MIRQTAIMVWLCEEDINRLRAVGIPMEWAGDCRPNDKPKLWNYYILETIYQQLKMWSTGGTEFAGMGLETFLRTVNDKDKECTTTNTSTST